MGFEPSLGAYYPPEKEARCFIGGFPSETAIIEAQAQLDNLASILRNRGIIVRRPEAYPANSSIRTPDFSIEFGNSYACPRDVLLVIGDLVIEAPMAQRSRFFEYRGYRNILIDHFEAGGRWLAAPKPFMNDDSFADNYSTVEQPFHPEEHPVLLTRDPCFDAASFTRCGRDIFWQPDLVSNANGAEWLGRALGSDFRIHRAEFEDRYPQHIDTTLVPLREGLVMINSERPPKTGSLKLFENSGWSIVCPPASVRRGLPAPARDVSNWISMNVLVLDQETVIVEEAEEPLAEFLEDLSFEVLPVPFEKVYRFGGGFHCCTVDVRRDGILKSYFCD
tara:strand:- start:129617 stop:130621 length:1005 start_codon:yes stop_codon:yes gene_type:complete